MADLESTRQRVSELETFRQVELDRRGRMLLAHRELMVDAVRRIARTETERARKRGANPDNLRKWVEAHYDEHGLEAVADILYPAVLAHLTWMRSDDDPRAAARKLAQEYNTQSAEQLRTLADGMVGEEFQTTLDAVLTRWVHERPEAVAVKVIHHEIDHLARQ
jgi:hypothetical protein